MQALNLLRPVTTAAQDPKTPHTVKTAEHIPCRYAYIIIGPLYREMDAVDHFPEALFMKKIPLPWN